MRGDCPNQHRVEGALCTATIKPPKRIAVISMQVCKGVPPAEGSFISDVENPHRPTVSGGFPGTAPIPGDFFVRIQRYDWHIGSKFNK